MKCSLLDRLILIVALAVTFASVVQAHGQELPLFNPPAVSAETSSLNLFTAPKAATRCDCLDLFVCGESLAVGQPAKADARPVVIAWCPSWCRVCRTMESLVGDGDDQVRVRWIKGDPKNGDEKGFLPEVQAYASSRDKHGNERGWPVLQFQPVDGKGAWRFASKARSMEDLHVLSKLKAADDVPPSRFIEAVKRKLAVVLYGGDAETAPAVVSN